MAKILIFQHVPYEPLGVLDPLLRDHKHRVRYINFARPQTKLPTLENYEGLIVLGGPMNIGQEQDYPHLDLEKKAIQEAIKLGVPVLGICLGAQLLACALGARVYQAPQSEIGWYPLTPTEAGKQDPLIEHFNSPEQVFQWHGYTFDLPDGAELLATGEGCRNQAFRYGDLFYGFQFHLEACVSLIERWLSVPSHLKELSENSTINAADRVADINHDTEIYLSNSSVLAERVFSSFIELVPEVRKRHSMPSR